MHLDQGWQEGHLWEEVLVVRSFPSSPYFNVLGDDSLVVGAGLREVHKAWWMKKDISIFIVKRPGKGNLYAEISGCRRGGGRGLREIQKNV